MKYEAAWQGLKLKLMTDGGEWRVWVDGRLTKQRWDDHHAAQAQVDATILKLITAARPSPSIKALITMCTLAAIARDRGPAGRLGVEVDDGRYRFTNEAEAEHA
jgi:hypothetical protein